MTPKPSDLPHQIMRQVHADSDAFHDTYGDAIADVKDLMAIFRKEHGTITAAILTLATIHATPEGDNHG